jgi:hypothetical protein
MMPDTGTTTAKKHNGHNKLAQGERTLSRGEPARPLLRVLPLKRWIPQDVHSVMDYTDGLTVASGALMADCSPTARMASMALGASVIGVSLLTDYRLSAAKVIPIRTHEALDYLWGASCIAAPFVLGYWKKSPATAMTHVAVGVGTILASLFTDYRSYKQQREDDRRRSQADLAPVMPT